MDMAFKFTAIFSDGKRFGLRHHVARHAGCSIYNINGLIYSGQIAVHLIGVQVYVDVDEALSVISKTQFGVRRSAHNLFA